MSQLCWHFGLSTVTWQLFWWAIFSCGFIKHGPMFMIFCIHNQHTSETGVRMRSLLFISFVSKCSNKNNVIHTSLCKQSIKNFCSGPSNINHFRKHCWGDRVYQSVIMTDNRCGQWLHSSRIIKFWLNLYEQKVHNTRQFMTASKQTQYQEVAAEFEKIWYSWQVSGSGRQRTAHTDENVHVVELFVLITV